VNEDLLTKIDGLVEEYRQVEVWSYSPTVVVAGAILLAAKIIALAILGAKE
jgi:hypothetical protein